MVIAASIVPLNIETQSNIIAYAIVQHQAVAKAAVETRTLIIVTDRKAQLGGEVTLVYRGIANASRACLNARGSEQQTKEANGAPALCHAVNPLVGSNPDPLHIDVVL